MSTMRRNRRPPAARGPRGFALLSAIFLIVMLAALAVFITYFSSIQEASSEADIMGVRAYNAAKAGIEVGVYQSLVAPPCPATTNLPAGTFAGSSLAGFTVTVSCVSHTYSEGAVSITMNQVTSNACNQPTGALTCPNTSGGTVSPGYVERELTVTVAK